MNNMILMNNINNVILMKNINDNRYVLIILIIIMWQ